MNTRLPQRKRFFRSLVSFPTKIIGFLFQSIFILLLAGFFLLLLSGIYLGVYVSHHLDDPMSYTPYPVLPQPPEKLTFQQFLISVDAYYDNQYSSISSNEVKLENNLLYIIIENAIRNDAFLINQVLSMPMIVGSVGTSSIATIYPESGITQNMSRKDFKLTVEPLKGKYHSLSDFPEIIMLQTQSHYWYVFSNEFMDYYQEFGLTTQ
ncbi:MAG: hypothetical protein K8R40_13500 [Anaerolineaceae bacterium]|nr:hypothetical protein [Anaerolineaceae bacterium]